MSSEHQEVSDFIKKVHIDLRVKARLCGAENAWKEHCKNETTLQKYAVAMHRLATEFWRRNESLGNLSRITWVVEECDNYFWRGGRAQAMAKEKEMYVTFFQRDDWDEYKWRTERSTQIKLLDVGSCYNPFGEFSQFDVTAIDLAPATSNVIRGDFLDMEMNRHPLLANHYDVVVFCLLLEYMPSARQRLEACKRAVELLAFGGLLIIITPDSKHSSANAGMIRRWRLALSGLGLLKRAYSKSKHLHCLSFFKVSCPELAKLWRDKQKDGDRPCEEELWAIPQDSTPYLEAGVNEVSSSDREDNDTIKYAFSELPGLSV